MSEVKVNKLSPRSGTTVTLGDSGDTFAITSGASISGFTSTGIDDNATSTAITIDSSENVDIVGTTTSSNFISDGTGYGIKFPLNGTATLNTSSNSVIFTGSGSSGDYLAGTLNLQSRGNLDRDINLITGATVGIEDMPTVIEEAMTGEETTGGTIESIPTIDESDIEVSL